MTEHRPELACLVEALRADYDAAPRGEKMTALHLFGIIHAEELAGLNGQELITVAEAAGSVSFATELRKMMKLARHVEPKPSRSDDEPLSATFLRHARTLPADFRFDREEANRR